MSSGPPQLSLFAVFVRFLRFGLLAWGGPVAQIGMLRDELVDRERWVEPGRFNRVLGVYQALPGPEAHELCVYFGMLARGRLGGFVAGLGFMLPGVLAVLAVSWLYVNLGIDGALAGALIGAQVAAVALVFRAVHRIGSHALHGPMLWLIAVAAAVATAGGLHFAIVLVAGAVAYAFAAGRRGQFVSMIVLALAVAAAWLPAFDGEQGARLEPAKTAPHAGEASSQELARAGLAAGSLSFGGAYTVIGFVRHDAVEQQGWLTDQQFLDGLALSGSLPAPLIVFATFVGYLGGGLSGALVMTVAIFVPAFAVTLIGHRALERIVDEPRIHRLLDGLTAAVVGLIAVTALALAQAAVTHAALLALLVAALVVLQRWRARMAIVAVVLGSALLTSIATSIA